MEARNFDIRKQLLEYDDVANDQRKVIYQQRNELLEAADIAETIAAMRGDVIARLLRACTCRRKVVEEQWDMPGLERTLAAEFRLKLPIAAVAGRTSRTCIDETLLRSHHRRPPKPSTRPRWTQAGEGVMRHFERAIMLQSLDNHWREHLAALDHLRQGIHLRGYAQKNPKQEYKREAFELFGNMLDTVKREVTQVTMLVQVRGEEDVEAVDKPAELENVRYQHADFEEALAAEAEPAAELPQAPVMRDGIKVGRNDPCPCGSGKKYKQCHGALS